MKLLKNFYRSLIKIFPSSVSKNIRGYRLMLTTPTKSYSQLGEDILIKNYIDSSINFYVDVGCYHPKSNSNTYLLHLLGWQGINIDIDDYKIQLFNQFRPNSINLLVAISDTEGEVVDIFENEYYSTTNTISKEFAERQESVTNTNYQTIKTIQTRKLQSILDEYKIVKVDFLNIDVEGHDLEVLRSLDYSKVRPKIIAVEDRQHFIDQLETSEIYNFLKQLDYYPVAKNGLSFIYNGLSFIYIDNLNHPSRRRRSVPNSI